MDFLCLAISTIVTILGLIYFKRRVEAQQDETMKRELGLDDAGLLRFKNSILQFSRARAGKWKNEN